jgi:Recombinase
LGGFRVRNVNGAAANRAKADEFAAQVAPMMAELRASGLSLDAIAKRLAADGVVTPRGGAWTATAVRRALRRA